MGGTSSDWHTASNWNPAVVPSSGSSVTIPQKSVYPVISSGDVVISSLTVSDWSAGQLTVNNGRKIEVTSSLQLNNYAQIYLNNGSFEYSGSSNFSTSYSPDTMFILDNNASLTFNSSFKLNSFIKVNDGSLNFNDGLEVSSSKSITMVTGDLNTLGDVKIYGIINGGEAQFTFDGNPASDDLVIRSGGRFYMDMVDGSCTESLTKPAPTTNGTIDFKIPSTVENNGQLHIGDAIVTYYHDIQTQGGAIVTIWNGQLIFTGDGVFGNSSSLTVECKGSIIINGDGTFQQSGNIDIGDGTLSIGGTATFANSGTLDAEDGDITFQGDVTIANSGGTINSGNSEIIFEGGTFDNSGTFNADSSTFVFAGDGEQNITGNDIEFYDVVIEDGADVVTSVNVVINNDLDVEGGGTLTTDETDGDEETIDVIGDLNGDDNVEFDYPFITNIIINSSTSITVVFDEEVTAITSEVEGNYSISNNSGATNPTISLATRIDTNLVNLNLSTSLVKNIVYTLTVNGIQDVDGNPVSTNHRKKL